MNIDEFYKKVGGQKEEAMERFGYDEAVLTRFLKKLMFDKTYDNLIQAYFKSEKESLCRSANTLESLYANFGFDEAASLSNSITKSSYYSFDRGVDAGIGQLSIIHDKIIEGLKTL